MTYLGVFDDVARALEFDEEGFRRAYFPDVDRPIAGYEGLTAAQECLPTPRPGDIKVHDSSNTDKLRA